MSGDDLAARQAALVAALVAGAPAPPGFDPARVRAAAEALLRKRAGEVAAAWPSLRTDFGADWPGAFAAWAAGRPSAGALRDGWDFARDAAAAGRLGPLGAAELAERDVRWRYDGRSAPRRRRAPAYRHTPDGSVLQVFGRVLRGRRGEIRLRLPRGPVART
jgi:hypothetical protein